MSDSSAAQAGSLISSISKGGGGSKRMRIQSQRQQLPCWKSIRNRPEVSHVGSLRGHVKKRRSPQAFQSGTLQTQGGFNHRRVHFEYLPNVPDAKVTVSLLCKQISGPVVRANNEAVSGAQRTVSTARASVQTAPVKRAHNGDCLTGANTWRGATTPQVNAILQLNPLPSCIVMLQRAASI